MLKGLKRILMGGLNKTCLKGWNSWIDYVRIRKELKQVLKSIVNFGDPKARFFRRWKIGDPRFNEYIQNMSRKEIS
jgi:hypothetical protein